MVVVMEKNVIRECSRHGETAYVLVNNDRAHYACMKCRTEAVQRRRVRIKEMAVEYKGGKCERCGYCKSLKAMEFHHIDPTQKDFGIGYKGRTRSWEVVKAELDKCILLCANCHREVHEELMLEEE
jgi:5-methylcytosine-specific restriction endonuclease McrA